MQVKLKWVNRNTLVVTTTIYRNDEYTNSESLGEPIATLPGSTTEWIDNTAVRGKDYWYTLGTTFETTKVFSKPVKVSVRYDTGPGPSTLQYGDSELGYFGVVEAVDFFSQQEILDQLGLSAASIVNPLPTWDKWLRRGKVIFIPRLALSTQSHAGLYAKGAVFGPDRPKPTWVTGATVPQNATVSKGFYKCVVRLMTGLDDRVERNSSVATVTNGAVDRRYSEVADFIYPINSTFYPDAQRFPRCPNAVGVSAATTMYAICQEFILDAQRVITGSAGTSTAATFTATAVNYTQISPGAWKPALELVQSDLILKEIVL